jgi:hypothetical protein
VKNQIVLRGKDLALLAQGRAEVEALIARLEAERAAK